VRASVCECVRASVCVNACVRASASVLVYIVIVLLLPLLMYFPADKTVFELDLMSSKPQAGTYIVKLSVVPASSSKFARIDSFVGRIKVVGLAKLTTASVRAYQRLCCCCFLLLLLFASCQWLQ
jgi:hypothetical protein